MTKVLPTPPLPPPTASSLAPLALASESPDGCPPVDGGREAPVVVPDARDHVGNLGADRAQAVDRRRRAQRELHDADASCEQGPGVTCRLLYAQCAWLAEAGFPPGGFDPPTAALHSSETDAAAG